MVKGAPLGRRLGRLALLLGIVCILVTLGTACNKSGSGTASAHSPARADAVFEVTTPDGRSVPFSTNELRELPLTSIVVEGKAEEGPALVEVLRKAGVDEFNQVTLAGNGASLTLTREQVTSEVILDLTNRGTVKLAAPNVPKNDWVKDITRIKVE